jgi:hypothetical protein
MSTPSMMREVPRAYLDDWDAGESGMDKLNEIIPMPPIPLLGTATRHLMDVIQIEAIVNRDVVAWRLPRGMGRDFYIFEAKTEKRESDRVIP